MITRLYSDDAGETHFEDCDLPADQATSHAGTMDVRGLMNVPALVFSIVDMATKALPADFHSTTPRKATIVLRGTIEMSTSDGNRRRFGPGDCVFTDDRGSKGHAFEDVGDEPLLSVVIDIANDWEYRGA